MICLGSGAMTKKGAGAGGMEYSPSRRRRRQKQLRAEENRWAAKAGPVTVRYLDKGEHPDAAVSDPHEAEGAVKDDAES